MENWILWFSMVFQIFHTFGDKSSEMGGKVVAAAARDPKSAVRAHLVAEKLSLVPYFCPQTCSGHETMHIFSWAGPQTAPPMTPQK